MTTVELIYQKSLILDDAAAQEVLNYIQTLLKQQADSRAIQDNLDSIVGFLDDKTNGRHLTVEEINDSIAAAANEASQQ